MPLPILLAVFTLFVGSIADGVDFQKFPECGREACLPFRASTIGCADSDKDCFCSAHAPVNCSSTSCNGEDWYEVEDWFSKQCETTPIATLQELPQCGRQCLRDALIPQHCESQLTRNCFCRLENVFNSLDDCLVNGCGVSANQAAEMLEKYYRETCVYTANVDGTGTSGGPSEGMEDDKVQQDGDNGGAKLDTPEIIGLVTGIVAFVGMVIAVYLWVNKHWMKKNGRPLPGVQFLDPPPPYTAKPTSKITKS